MMRAIKTALAPPSTPVVRVCMTVVTCSIAMPVVVASAMMMASALARTHVMTASSRCLMRIG